MHRKLTDAQVKTMMHILVYSPCVPQDLTRFPTLRMLLEAEIIRLDNDTRKLHFNTECPENVYQYVAPTNLVDDVKDPSFEAMEKAGLLKFNPTAGPTDTDTFYFYDLTIFCAELEKLGARADLDGNRVLVDDAANTDKVKALITEFQAKYPSDKLSI